jgi:hypothetical protein
MRPGERWTIGALCGLVIAGAAAAPVGAYEHRRDTPSVGVQIQMGNLGRDSDWGKAFGWGRGVCIHLRNSTARNRAIGLTFEQQRFDIESPLPEDIESGLPTSLLQMQTLLFDYLFYFQRPQRRCYYAVASAGFYRPELVYERRTQAGQPMTSDVRYPGENFMGRIGGGTEYFVSRKFSFDGSISFYYLRAPDLHGLTASVQFALGVHVYAGR